jgi:hypothetical protein
MLAAQLAQDGVEWRGSLPSASCVEAEIATLARRAEQSGPSLYDGPVPGGPPADLPWSPATRSPRPHRLAGLASVAAVAAVVLLFVGVFALHALSMPRGYPSTGPSATATLPPGTAWVAQPKLDVVSSGYQAEDAVIAPSDPRVVYEAGSLLTYTQIQGNTFPTGKVFLRRTDDGGATWHSLPLPDAAHLGMLQDNSSNLTTALPSRRVKLWPIVRSLISGSTMS